MSGSAGGHQRNARLRVLSVIPGLDSSGGAERSLLAVVPWLPRHGITLHVAVLSDRQALVPPLERAGVVVHDLSSRSGPIGRVRALRKLIRDLSPDLVHATLVEASAPVQLAVLGTGVPVLVTWANTSYGLDRRREPGVHPAKLLGYQLLESVLGRLSDSWYHAVTPAVGRVNSAALRAPATRVLVGERGRDPDDFPRAGGARPPILLAVGRQDTQKGYETLLHAFDELADRRPDACLRIAGREGSATPTLAAVHRSMRHPDRVEFLGHRDDVPALMGSSAAVVCSSWREGAAGALIEAMACGTPIVSVPVTGLDGILVDGVNALVVPRERLAEGMEAVLGDQELAERLSAGGHRTFEERFTVGAAAERMAEIYRTVACAQTASR